MRRKEIVSVMILSLLIVSWLIFFQKQLEIFVSDSFFNKPSEILLANISQNIPQQETPKPIETPEFQAKSVLSLKINEINNEEILYQKNIQEKLPIASLTKLMTAVIVLENYDSASSPQDPLDEKILISKEAVAQQTDIGKLIIGESVSIKNLLNSMLIESSNDAAYALAEKIGVEPFLEMMNSKARELKLLNTNFSNPTGLDGNKNLSTSEDLAKLVKYIIQNHPEILEITSKVSTEILNDDGTLHHLAVNTNELLGKIPNIIGGKTGYNEEAMGCLILLLEKENNYLINIILGSPDRFAEMEKLVNWLKETKQF